MKALLLFAFQEGLQISIKKPVVGDGLMKLSIGNSVKRIAVDLIIDMDDLNKVEDSDMVERAKEAYLKRAYPERYTPKPEEPTDENITGVQGDNPPTGD